MSTFQDFQNSILLSPPFALGSDLENTHLHPKDDVPGLVK